MLNARGGIECDFTVTRLGPSRFRIVTGTAFGTHDRGFIQGHLPDDGSVALLDVTGAYCLHRPLGAASPGHPGGDDDRRRVERGLPVPHGPETWRWAAFRRSPRG